MNVYLYDMNVLILNSVTSQTYKHEHDIDMMVRAYIHSSFVFYIYLYSLYASVKHWTKN